MAHAFGTLVGAFLTALIAKTYRKALALIIGLTFLIGGIMMINLVPSPIWFSITDVVFAYVPMALLGYKIATNLKKQKRI